MLDEYYYFYVAIIGHVCLSKPSYPASIDGRYFELDSSNEPHTLIVILKTTGSIYNPHNFIHRVIVSIRICRATDESCTVLL